MQKDDTEKTQGIENVALHFQSREFLFDVGKFCGEEEIRTLDTL